jgi:hypothetical protein
MAYLIAKVLGDPYRTRKASSGRVGYAEEKLIVSSI